MAFTRTSRPEVVRTYRPLFRAALAGVAIDSMFNYMFKDLPHHLEEQREIARRFPAKGGSH